MGSFEHCIMILSLVSVISGNNGRVIIGLSLIDRVNLDLYKHRNYPSKTPWYLNKRNLLPTFINFK